MRAPAPAKYGGSVASFGTRMDSIWPSSAGQVQPNLQIGGDALMAGGIAVERMRESTMGDFHARLYVLEAV